MDLRNEAPTFWRKIRINPLQGKVTGEVKDNVHHFAVALEHDGAVIIRVEGSAIRFPWTTCPGAAGALTALIGTPVFPNARADVDQALQCTHMLDLAKLAIAQVARGGPRNYDILVRNDDDSETFAATIARDGERLFEWRVRGDTVVAPMMFEGHNLVGRAVWYPDVEVDPDLREAALALRRSVFIFRSRPRSQHTRSAGELSDFRGACYSFQAALVDAAIRPPGFVELADNPPEADFVASGPI